MRRDRKRKCALYIAVLAIMAAVTAGAFGQNTGAPALYNSVKSQYQRIKTFSADFSCEILLFGSLTNRVTGRLFIEPPGKWRMHLESPAAKAGEKPTLVLFDLCDGASRWTYDAGTRSILKYEVQQAERARPKNFFPAFELYDGLSVTLLRQEGKRAFLKLKSLKDFKQFAAVILEVNCESAVVERMEFVDWRGHTSMTVGFSNIEVDKSLVVGIFSPTGMPDLPVKTVQPESGKSKEGDKR